MANSCVFCRGFGTILTQAPVWWRAGFVTAAVPCPSCQKPRIVCLVGSTRFKKEFLGTQIHYGARGYVVLTVVCFTHADRISFPPETLRLMKELHLRKIEMADLVFVVNRDGYIGESTAREIAHAKTLGKPVLYLEKPVGTVVNEERIPGARVPTPHLRWMTITVQRPSSFHGGPGFTEKVKQLQQEWVCVNDGGVEWRPVPDAE